MIYAYRMLFVLGTVLLMATTAAHALWMPAVFSSNMVLQRGPQQAQLWGSAAPNSVVKFTLDSAAYGTFADANGRWQFEMPAQPAGAGHTLTVAGDSTTMTFDNVAFGDVYICSGQSNMEMVIGDAFNASETFANSINYPNLRLFTVARLTSNTPVNDTTSRFPDTNGWLVSSPGAVNGSSWSYFSATCYFFGEALYNNLGGAVPIGLIETCWGGTRVEAWTTADGLAVCGPVVPELDGTNPDVETLAGPDGKVQDDPQAASVLWNGMVAPFVNLRLTGVTWYQGEANAGNATNYACRFPAMIQDWRTQFNNYKLYFYFVVLAAYKEGGNPTWSLIRDAQLQALELPYVGAATAQDLGDELSGLGPIHPRNKTIVGERLSLNAQFQVYGQNVISMGPSYTDIVWPLSKAGVQTAILRFRSDDMYAQDLHLLGTSGCSACCNMTGSPIALVLSDGTTEQAEVQAFPDLYMVTATVDLTSKPGVYVTGLQLNWVDYPECALYNSANLPHLPFSVSQL